MQQTEQIIALLHIGFIVCICLAVLFAVLSIVLFFKLRIRDVFDFLTGRAQKRTIRQMEEVNAQTGKLRQDTFIPEATGDLYRTPSGSIPPIIYPPTGKTATGAEPTEHVHRDGPYVQGSGGIGGYSGSMARDDDKTEMLSGGTEETTLLPGEGSEETTILNEGTEETMLLTPELEQAMQQEQETKKPYSGKFEIIKEMMLIHTEEII